MKRIALTLLAGCLIGGCAVHQLEDFKNAEKAKNYAAIDGQKIAPSCFADQQTSDECAQLTEIQGRACMTLALQEAAPNAACPPPTATASRHLQCAAQDFGAAVKGGQVASEDLNDDTEMRARALYCGATFVARAEGLPNVREAARELDTLTANPQRDQLAAATALYVANSEQLSSTDRCSAAQLAVDRANRGLQGNPTDNIKQGLSDTRAHALSVAGQLTGCRTH
jgi:hypothetical protein